MNILDDNAPEPPTCPRCPIATDHAFGAEPAIRGWHHVAVPVSDLDRSLRWYEQVLFAIVDRRTDVDARDVAAGRTGQVWLRVGDAIVNLAEAAVVHRRPEQHFFHYALHTDGADLDAWLAHLAARGVTILGPYGHGGLPFLSVYFDDPDGYRWEIVVDYADFAAARAAAAPYGGRLGNPTADYEWPQ